ncbi:MAG: squalene/phytoene synthase family protein [Planctomycetia bacterium]|nr:squalene/phytoene synthase family protein [Planctomycetia bacterium]
MSAPSTIGTRHVSLDESYRLCRELARRAARNFYYAFWVLPPEKQRAMCALYAFFRRTDDLGDDQGSVEEKRAALNSWRAALRRAWSADLAQGEEFADPLLPALIDSARRFRIPAEYFEIAIEGVESDLDRTGFATFAELEAYCYQVASVVGLACIHVWGFDPQPAAYEAARRCGLAFQLTNILRDIVEDANLGRTYLPLEDLARYDLTPAQLAATKLEDAQAAERRRALVHEVSERAEAYYRDARALLPFLSRDGKSIYAAMFDIYHALLLKMRRRNYDVFTSRVRLPAWYKAALALRRMWPKLLPFRTSS